MKLSKPQYANNDSIIVTVKVKNTGAREGEEIVQLYMQDKTASITRPVKELKGFQKIVLQKGESKTVTFILHNNDLAFYNSELKKIVEPGIFNIFVGGNSEETLKTSFELL